MDAHGDIKGRWEHVGKFLRRGGPFVSPGFTADTAENPTALQFLREKSRILVIGSGGLGCELLKDLALSGFRNIDVIDMDTIDVSNLNRQFLFRPKDVGRPKSEVAAAFINQRVPGVKVTAHVGKIQDKDDDFYRQFALIICGLDSIDARRWMNSTLINLVELDENDSPVVETIIPMIDGGTEGWRGQARVILPRMSACFECAIDTFPPQQKFPMCTLAHTPRVPAHCIQWASVLHWDEVKPFGANPHNPKAAVPIDTDNPEHMKWLYEKALTRAKEHHIEGVTYKLTQGVVKNIIPAIASTNALVSAICANEALKIATNISSYLNNYMMYMGDDGLFTHTFEYAKKDECPACGSKPYSVKLNGATELKAFVDFLREDSRFQLKNPSIRCNGKNVLMQSPPQLKELTKPNLDKALKDLFSSGSSLDITDPVLNSVAISVEVNFE